MANSKDQTANETPAPAPKAAAATGKPMPDGDGALEYRRDMKLHLTKAGPVVKSNWVGRILGRSVRVYYGAQEKNLPEAVRKAVLASGIPIGVLTMEELNLKPRETSIVNLSQQQG